MDISQTDVQTQIEIQSTGVGVQSSVSTKDSTVQMDSVKLVDQHTQCVSLVKKTVSKGIEIET